MKKYIARQVLCKLSLFSSFLYIIITISFLAVLPFCYETICAKNYHAGIYIFFNFL